MRLSETETRFLRMQCLAMNFETIDFLSFMCEIFHGSLICFTNSTNGVIRVFMCGLGDDCTLEATLLLKLWCLGPHLKSFAVKPP